MREWWVALALWATGCSGGGRPAEGPTRPSGDSAAAAPDDTGTAEPTADTATGLAPTASTAGATAGHTGSTGGGPRDTGGSTDTDTGPPCLDDTQDVAGFTTGWTSPTGHTYVPGATGGWVRDPQGVWQPECRQTPRSFRWVGGVDDDHVWAVAAEGIVRRDPAARAWVDMGFVGDLAALRGLAVTGPDQVLAVSEVSGQTVLHAYDAGAWTVTDTAPTAPPTALATTPDGELVGAAAGGFVVFRQGAWAPMPVDGLQATLHDVSIAADGTVAGAGTWVVRGTEGAFVRELPASTTIFTAVAAEAVDDVWAFGWDYTNPLEVFVHWDGQDWSTTEFWEKGVTLDDLVGIEGGLLVIGHDVAGTSKAFVVEGGTVTPDGP